MKGTRGIDGVLKALAMIVTPVAVLVIAASKYPTMIERRIEQNKKSREALAPVTAKTTTIEIISPDPKSHPGLEHAVRNSGVGSLESATRILDNGLPEKAGNQ